MVYILSDKTYEKSLLGFFFVRRAAFVRSFEFSARYFTLFARYYFTEFVTLCVN